MFEAGGTKELGDVAERRLRLSASSFGRAVGQNLFWFSLVMIAVGVWQRRRLGRWLDDAPLARAGMLGAFGAVVLGVVANDSGATFLMIGTIGMLGIVAFACSRYAAECPNGRRYPDPMRIALVSPYSWTYQGGVNRHVEALAEQFLARGDHVRVLAPWDPPDASRRLHGVSPRGPRAARLAGPARPHGRHRRQRRGLQPRPVPRGPGADAPRAARRATTT